MEFTHIANPVRVTAQAIREVSAPLQDSLSLTLMDGSEYIADLSMIARYCPQTGDYLVRQEDGYEYINPKAVFERKYSPI